jgi:hypothetical protein
MAFRDEIYDHVRCCLKAQSEVTFDMVHELTSI